MKPKQPDKAKDHFSKLDRSCFFGFKEYDVN